MTLDTSTEPAMDADTWNAAIASANTWRGQAIQCFAQAEAAVSETLLALITIQPQGSNIKLRRLVGQRFEDLQMALSSEGVFAVDSELRIISMNEAASTLLRVDANVIKGRPILEAVRNTALRDFVQGALASQAPVEAELSVGRREPLVWRRTPASAEASSWSPPQFQLGRKHRHEPAGAQGWRHDRSNAEG